MSRPRPTEINAEQAGAAYPKLCAYVASVLRAHKVPAADDLLRALDACDPEAGNKLSGFDQNCADAFPDKIDNFWRILSAYADVMTGATYRGASEIMPWMVAVAAQNAGVYTF